MFKKIISKLVELHSIFKAWKPIHLCWWFEKHNLPIPSYLIGGGAVSHQRYYIIGDDSGTTDPDTQTWGTENTSASKGTLTPFFVRISASEEGGGNWNNQAFELWYNDTGTLDGGATQVTTTTGAVATIVNDPGDNITDQAATDLDTVLTTTGAYVSGHYIDVSNVSTTISLNTECTDVQFCIQFESGAAGNTYYFFLRGTGNTVLNNYEIAATVTVELPSSSSSSSLSSSSSSQSSSSSSLSSSSSSSQSSSSSSLSSSSSSSQSSSSSSLSSSSSATIPEEPVLVDSGSSLVYTGSYQTGAVDLGSVVDAGNMIVVCYTIDKASGAQTVTCTGSNDATISQNHTANIVSGGIAYKVSEGDEQVINVNWATAQTGYAIWVGVFSGVAQEAPDDSNENTDWVSAPNPSDTQATGDVTTTQTNEMIIGVFCADSENSIGDADPTWSNAESVLFNGPSGVWGGGNPYISVGRRDVTNTGTYNDTATMPASASDETYGCIAAFKYAEAGSSSSSSSNSSSSSSSSSSWAYQTPGAVIWGEEDPVLEEESKSWLTWSDGAGGTPALNNWGRLCLESGAEAWSTVEHYGDSSNQTIIITLGRYATDPSTEEGSFTIYIRGQTSIFSQDDGTPSWEEYTGSVIKNWEYMQIRLVGI